MNSLNIISRGIDNGLNVLVRVGRSIGNGLSGHVPRNTNSSSEDDIEMNAYGSDDVVDLRQALDSGPNETELATRPGLYSTHFTSIIQFFSNLSMPVIRRPRFIREMGEFTSAYIILILLFFFATTWIATPFGVSTPVLYITNWNRFQSSISNWLNPQTRDVTASYTPLADIPGVYMVLPDEAIQESLPDDLNDDAKNAHTSVFRQNYPLDESSYLNIPDKFKRQISDEDRPFHHAYPIHAGRVEKSEQALHIKSQLERCAENMLRKLKGQGLEITPGFEFALHDCKAAVEFALETIYPANAHAGNPKSKRAAAIYGVVPGQTLSLAASPVLNAATAPPNTEIKSKYYSDLFKNKPCVERFCDWVSSANLERCYHRNETEYYSTGKITFTNDSVDDFKENAPLECNLCLPEANKEDIEVHCKEVKESESKSIKHLLIAASCFVSFLVVSVLVRIAWKRYQGPTHGRIAKSRPSRKSRILVMPMARSSSVSVRGGHLDKRLISYPVPISRPAEEVEGAFENPRAAPLPPSWL